MSPQIALSLFYYTDACVCEGKSMCVCVSLPLGERVTAGIECM